MTADDAAARRCTATYEPGVRTAGTHTCSLPRGHNSPHVCPVCMTEWTARTDSNPQPTDVRPWEHTGHRPVQHRDGKPPWCRQCGWTSPTAAIPAEQIEGVWWDDDESADG